MKLADAFPDDLWGRKARRFARVDRATRHYEPGLPVTELGTVLVERELERHRYQPKQECTK